MSDFAIRSWPSVSIPYMHRLCLSNCHVCIHDIIHKTKCTLWLNNDGEKMSHGNMQRKFGRLDIWFLRYACGQTERYADCDTFLPYWKWRKCQIYTEACISMARKWALRAVAWKDGVREARSHLQWLIKTKSARDDFPAAVRLYISFSALKRSVGWQNGQTQPKSQSKIRF